jgi:hypothetical protein
MMRNRHRQIFWQDSCSLVNTYYFDKNGDVPLRPGTTLEGYWRSRRYPDERLQVLCLALDGVQTDAKSGSSTRGDAKAPDLAEKWGRLRLFAESATQRTSGRRPC